MKTRSLVPILLVLIIPFLTGCTPEPGVGGKRDIKGTVKYNGDVAKGAKVYLYYDATEKPKDGNYNDATITDDKGQYMFQGLNKGDYVIDAEYTDANGLHFTTPGKHVKLGEKKGEITVDLKLE